MIMRGLAVTFFVLVGLGSIALWSISIVEHIGKLLDISLNSELMKMLHYLDLFSEVDFIEIEKNRFLNKKTKSKIFELNSKGIYNILLDGFPRNYENLESWNKIVGDSIKLKFVIYLKCPENIILCTGFMIIRCNDRNKQVFINSLKHIEHFEHDQYAFNYFRKGTNWRFLPEDKYYTIAYNTGNDVWRFQKYDNIPKTILMHHANWIGGIENKIKLLDYIKSELSGKAI